MPNIIKYTIRMGDTIQGISQTVLGDAGRWMEIALLNDLDYPFIALDNTVYKGKVAHIGDEIFIPRAVGASDTSDSLTIHADDRLYGTDLLLSSTGDNLYNSSNSMLQFTADGDIATVSGLQCLQQDLINRLLTELGTLPYHPEYGSNFLSIVGNKNSGTWVNKAVVEVTRTFRCDPRVLDVKNATVKSVHDTIYIDCTIITGTTEFNISQTIPNR